MGRKEYDTGDEEIRRDGHGLIFRQKRRRSGKRHFNIQKGNSRFSRSLQRIIPVIGQKNLRGLRCKSRFRCHIQDLSSIRDDCSKTFRINSFVQPLLSGTHIGRHIRKSGRRHFISLRHFSWQHGLQIFRKQFIKPDSRRFSISQADRFWFCIQVRDRHKFRQLPQLRLILLIQEDRQRQLFLQEFRLILLIQEQRFIQWRIAFIRRLFRRRILRRWFTFRRRWWRKPQKIMTLLADRYRVMYRIFRIRKQAIVIWRTDENLLK